MSRMQAEMNFIQENLKEKITCSQKNCIQQIVT